MSDPGPYYLHYDHYTKECSLASEKPTWTLMCHMKETQANLVRMVEYCIYTQYLGNVLHSHPCHMHENGNSGDKKLCHPRRWRCLTFVNSQNYILGRFTGCKLYFSKPEFKKINQERWICHIVTGCLHQWSPGLFCSERPAESSQLQCHCVTVHCSALGCDIK